MFSGFMLNTWLVATMVAIVAGLVGFFVVVRGATFAAHALPLGIFPGAAAAGLLGVNQLWGLLGFAALGVAGIGRLGRRQRSDVATALTLITLLGLGTLFLSLSAQYAQSVYALLFGEVLGIAGSQIPPVAMISLAVCAAVLLLFRPLLLGAVSADLAALRGMRPALVEWLFLAILALATAMALPVVGALLVFSLMIGPAALARAVTARPARAMFLSAGIAVAMAWGAIAASCLTNWPVGFFVGGLAAVCYFAGRARHWLTASVPAGRAEPV
jgi:zinc/manganese transport system permease protein